MRCVRKLLLVAICLVMMLPLAVANVAVSGPTVRLPDEASHGAGKSDAESCGSEGKMPAPETVIAQAGCCWPSGVCGCSGGRVMCCNGSISPTCRCHGRSDKRPSEIEPHG